MNKVHLIVFSKDRATQLHLLLESIYACGWAGLFDVSVLWKASTPKFAQGYDLCSKAWRKPKFYAETNKFDEEIKDLVASTYKFTCFSTDDMVFYDYWPGGTLDELNSPNFLSRNVFSLRLGYNTIEQDIHAGTKQPALNLHIREGDIIKWRPSNYHPLHNYGYPLALDTHIFHTEFIGSLINRFKWKNSNELEAGLQRYSGEVNELWSYTRSKSVNIPTNTVSGVTRAGEKFAHSLDSLNDAYLEGHVINLEHIQDTKIVGCHQEIELKLQ